MDSTDLMRRLDQEYRGRSGLHDRRHYSIFYSRVLPSDVLVLGYNPGGDPDAWDESALSSPSYFEGGEHEYVDRDYPIARAMRPFLVEVLGLRDSEDVRAVPKTNLIFRRSRSQDAARFPARQAIEEAKPTVLEILRVVRPRVVVLEGMTTADAFERHYCSDVRRALDGVVVTTPNGSYDATIYRADDGDVEGLDGRVGLLGIGHPSRYAGRREWADVKAAAHRFVRDRLGRRPPGALDCDEEPTGSRAPSP